MDKFRKAFVVAAMVVFAVIVTISVPLLALASESPTTSNNIIESTNTESSNTAPDNNASDTSTGATNEQNTATSNSNASKSADIATTTETSGLSGVVTISSAISSQMLDIADGSLASGASTQISLSNYTASQRYRLTEDSDGYYTITNVKSGKVLDVTGAIATDGTVVQQWDANGSDAQKWVISTNADGTFTIVSKLHASDGASLVIDVPEASSASGTRLQVYEANDTSAQRWTIAAVEKTIDEGVYSLTSQVDSTSALDVAGGSATAGANIQIWTSNSTPAQRFQLQYDEDTGYYTILCVASGVVVDVAGASESNGANIQQWTFNGTWAQEWAVSLNGDGTYTLYNAGSGLALDVTGASSLPGSNVEQYDANGTMAQQWTFTPTTLLYSGVYSIACSSDLSCVMDVTGDSREQGALIHIWSSNGTWAQKYTIEAYGTDGYYTIRNLGNGQYVGIASGSTAIGTNIDQAAVDATVGPSDSQLWKPTLSYGGMTFTSKTGLVIDVTSGNVVSGTNLQAWSSNGTSAQKFVPILTDATVTASIVDYEAETSGSEVHASYVSGTPYLFLPSTADTAAVKLHFFTSGGETPALISNSADGSYVEVSSGESLDLSAMNLTSDSGGWDLYVKTSETDTPTKLVILRSSGIRTMYITSDDPVNEGIAYIDDSSDHSTTATGSMVLTTASGSVVYNNDLAEIKGRGNSTWAYSDKKPYQIKLSKKTDLLSTGDSSEKNKTWVLLANADDSTLLHNTLAYKLALEMGLAGTTDCEPVDLYYDGEYRGSYLLCEKVQVDTGRVDITDMDDANDTANSGTDLSTLTTAQTENKYGETYQYVSGMNSPSDISGGYLLELDCAYYQSETSWFNTSAGVYVCHTPEYMSQSEGEYISDFLQEGIDCINNGGTITVDGVVKHTSDYFDIDSLAKMYLINEFSKNIDSFFSSTYFYKPAGEDKLYAGPVWDFGSSFGTRTDIQSLGLTYSGYFQALRSQNVYIKDPAVQAAVKRIYQDQFKDLIDNIVLGDESAKGTYLNSLVSYYNEISSSQTMNQVLWGVLSFETGFAPSSTYTGNIDYLTLWIKNRNEWLYSSIMTWDGSTIENDPTVYDGTDYGLVYDYSYYINQYPDLKAAFGDDSEAALEHFVKYGMAEGRQASLDFNLQTYKDRYPDLQAAFGDDNALYYQHFIQYGFYEGRTAT